MVEIDPHWESRSWGGLDHETFQFMPYYEEHLPHIRSKHVLQEAWVIHAIRCALLEDRQAQPVFEIEGFGQVTIHTPDIASVWSVSHRESWGVALAKAVELVMEMVPRRWEPGEFDVELLWGGWPNG